MLRWILTATLCALSSAGLAAETPEAISARLLDHLQAGQFDQAQAMLTPEMAQAVPSDKLKTVWASLGELKQRGQPRTQARDGMPVVTTRLEFAAAALDAQVAVNTSGKVAGFLLQPAAATQAVPPVPADAAYSERELSIGSGATALPATLAMPKGAGPFPAVVLVHGSGPQDRNETIGPNRPFLDIARGLAAQGIAVLRYEKRTRVHPESMRNAQLNVDQETTDDAVAALAVLRAQTGVDAKRLYVFGHSQGGLLAPRIAARSGQVAGVILFAAPARPLLDILLEQNVRLLGAQADTPQGQAHLDTLRRQIAFIRNPATAADATDTPLNLPVGYWRSIDQVDPVADAKALRQPMLLLQGGRDFQVVDADWQVWRGAFAKQARASFHHYPALNHLGIAGSGPGTLAEYQQAGHVDATLINDTARWIKEH